MQCHVFRLRRYTRRVFNSLLGVRKCGQTRSFVMDIYLPSWIKFSPHDNGHIEKIHLRSEPHGRGPKSL